jgi:hypothetical protein
VTQAPDTDQAAHKDDRGMETGKTPEGEDNINEEHEVKAAPEEDNQQEETGDTGEEEGDTKEEASDPGEEEGDTGEEKGDTGEEEHNEQEEAPEELGAAEDTRDNLKEPEGHRAQG